MLPNQKNNLQNNQEDPALAGKKVLIILPHDNFRDKELTWVVERLDPIGITVEIASSHLSDATGRFGTVVQPHVLVKFVSSGDYDAFIFIGEEAASEYYDDVDVQRLVDHAFATRKIVAAIGEAVPIIAYSGKISGKRVTSINTEQVRLEEAGAYFTGRLVEQDGDLITANGPYATREFAETVIKALKYAVGSGNGRQYLR